MVAKSISHHPRNPRIMSPLQIPTSHGFPMVSKWCKISSIHSIASLTFRSSAFLALTGVPSRPSHLCTACLAQPALPSLKQNIPDSKPRERFSRRGPGLPNPELLTPNPKARNGTNASQCFELEVCRFPMEGSSALEESD